ncbi:MAG: DUF6785 family protein [Lentisphaeria bacterium]|nr:DUF6785 family protein [Lentisphaeria bacterium]
MTDRETRAQSGITKRAFILGVALSAYFAWSTVMRENSPPYSMLSVNALPVMPYVGLFFLALIINPLLRRLKLIRAFSMGEMLLIFAMCAVTSGVATFGLAAPLVPIVSGLNNRDNNNDQSQWDRYVMPYLNEDYFIAVPGTRKAAQKYRDACDAYDRAKLLERTAKDMLTAREELARVAKEKERVARIGDPDLRAAEAKTLVWPEQQATKLLTMSTDIWNRHGKDLAPEAVAETYEEKIADIKQERDRLGEELKRLNSEAFAAVDLIRKGLPDDKRAVPGIMYSRGEGWSGYRARFQRLRVGSHARKRLSAAVDTFDSAPEKDTKVQAELASELDAVADLLTPLARIPAIEKRKDKLTGEAEKLEATLQVRRIHVRDLRQARRFARQENFPVFDEKIGELDASIATLDKKATALREKIEAEIMPSLAVCERVGVSQNALRDIAARLRSGNDIDPSAIRDALTAQTAAFASFDASYRRYFIGDSDWGLWARPILNWLVLIFLVYVVFMTFNTLIYRQWSHNEKLIYPIAEATTVLAASGDPDSGKGPSIYKSGLFWTGFAVAAGILFWNHLANTGSIPNVKPVKLETLWLPYVGNSIFKGMGSTYFCIIFAVIGLSFLVPSNISFSLWGFEVLYMCMLMVMAWMGYGANRWAIGNGSRMHLGSGAAWVFGLVILWTCRQYIFCLFRPKAIQKLPTDEQKELRWSSGAFLAALALLFLILVFRLEAGPFQVLKWFLMAIILTIAVTRAVCEAGVLGLEGGLQGIPSFMVKNTAGLSANAASNAAAVASSGAHLGILSGMVLGLKAFIAPVMANILKMREDIPGRRLTFHVAIWAGLLIATFVAIVTLIIISYDGGANSLFVWTNGLVPKSTFTGVKGMAAARGAAGAVNMRGWWIAGAVLMGLLLFSRQKIFGIPHPIGLVMLMNPVMFGFWGSVMLGWLFKSLASKYCNKEQYFSVRCFFIGLIVGHLVAGMMGWDRMEWHWG